MLLKYPPLTGDVQTLVDDAMYLRDHDSVAGGSAIIEKRSGRKPANMTKVPLSPDGSESPLPGPLRMRSPLLSPARFLQQQGGVEGLLQGAAKGVFDRGERLGINQAVRDAVGEVKKNMQGLQTPRPNSTRRADDATRWSLDQGRLVPSSIPTRQHLEQRNQHLAVLIKEAELLLKQSQNKDQGGEGIDYASTVNTVVDKLHHIRACLEDANKAVQIEFHDESRFDPPREAAQTLPAQNSPGTVIQSAGHDDDSRDAVTSPAIKDVTKAALEVKTHTPKSKQISHKIEEEITSPSISRLRPTAPIPTRSSIAQSSFAWMLEDPLINSDASKAPPSHKPSSPRTRHSKRGSTAGRERAAFLFGEETEDILPGSPKRSHTSREDDDFFKMATIRGSTGPY